MIPPAYLDLHDSGELLARAAIARGRLATCDLCGRECGVDRLTDGGAGACHTGEAPVVASAGPHFGEEEPLVGRGGSGTIFFAWCNLQCRFCQNSDLSHQGRGRPVVPSTLASIMLDLQDRGCHNINLVSPSHVIPPLLVALDLAVSQGLRLPIVYNTGGYDSLATLELLDGVIDIYMPDMKFANAAIALDLAGVDDYPAVNRAAVKEMHRQVGDLVIDDDGVARRGLLVRHLVLPDGLAGTAATVQFLREQVSADTYLNVMGQYRPCHQAWKLRGLDRPVATEEVNAARELASTAGLRLDRRLH